MAESTVGRIVRVGGDVIKPLFFRPLPSLYPKPATRTEGGYVKPQTKPKSNPATSPTAGRRKTGSQPTIQPKAEPTPSTAKPKKVHKDRSNGNKGDKHTDRRAGAPEQNPPGFKPRVKPRPQELQPKIKP
jgi:hypothetical protein